MKRTLLALALCSPLLAACGSSTAADTNDDDLIVGEGKEDNFFSSSAREYTFTGKATVTIEEALANKSAAEKLRRVKELIPLRSLAISWFLNSYLIDKEEKDANADYGGFGALVRFSSEETSEPKALDARTFEFAYAVQAAGSPTLGRRLGGSIDLEVGKPSNAEMADLTFNSEWYREAPWEDWDPSKVSADQKETIKLAVAAQARTNDAYLAYDRLLADGKITVGVHFGWDYHSRADISGSRNLYNHLVREGFKSPVASYEKLLRTSGPLTKTIQSNGKPIKIEVSIFHPGDASQNVPGPDPDTDEGGKVLEADMRDSFANREVIMFEGHSGPLYGFALANWKKTEEGDLDDSKIAGLQMPKTYQIVLANGCDTYALGQAFWNNPAKADQQSLNIITTTSFSNAETDASARRLLKALYNQSYGKLVPVKVSELTAGLDSDQGWGFTTMFGVYGVDANPKYDPMSDASKLCQSCSANSDCGADGNRCTKIKTGVKACTIGCIDDTGCPSNYACRSVASATSSTIKTKQCVPVSLSCR